MDLFTLGVVCGWFGLRFALLVCLMVFTLVWSVKR